MERIMNKVNVRKEFETAVAEKLQGMISRFFCGDGSVTCGAYVHEFAWELLTLAKAEVRQTAWHGVSEKPDSERRVVVCTNGRTLWMAMTYDLLGAERWAYIEDLIPCELIKQE